MEKYQKKQEETSFDSAAPDMENNCRVERISWYSHNRVAETLCCHYANVAIRHGSCANHHHNYRHLAVEMVVDGSLTYEQFGRRETVGKGEIYLMHQNQDSAFFSPKNGYYTKLALCVSGSLLKVIVEAFKLKETSKITPRSSQEAEERFRELIRLLEEKKAGTEKLLAERSYGLLLYLSEEAANAEQFSYPEPLRIALEEISAYMKKDLNLDGLATKSGVSTATLVRLFRTHLDCAPMEYVTNTRMAFARNLLASTELPLKEIAYRIGYSDPLYFSTAFRKRHGQSPRTFRLHCQREQGEIGTAENS